MTDNPQQIRNAARAVQRLIDAGRTTQGAVARGDGASWSGPSADRYRTRLGDRSRELAHCIDELSELRTRLLAHARAVERHETAIAAARVTPGGPTVGQVRSAVGHGIDVVKRHTAPSGGSVPCSAP